MTTLIEFQIKLEGLLHDNPLYAVAMAIGFVADKIDDLRMSVDDLANAVRELKKDEAE